MHSIGDGEKDHHLAENYWLLLDTQREALSPKIYGVSIELLTEQVHSVWGQVDNKVATLGMDVAGIFDTVSYKRLLNSLSR